MLKQALLTLIILLTAVDGFFWGEPEEINTVICTAEQFSLYSCRDIFGFIPGMWMCDEEGRNWCAPGLNEGANGTIEHLFQGFDSTCGCCSSGCPVECPCDACPLPFTGDFGTEIKVFIEVFGFVLLERMVCVPSRLQWGILENFPIITNCNENCVNPVS